MRLLKRYSTFCGWVIPHLFLSFLSPRKSFWNPILHTRPCLYSYGVSFCAFITIALYVSLRYLCHFKVHRASDSLHCRTDTSRMLKKHKQTKNKQANKQKTQPIFDSGDDEQKCFCVHKSENTAVEVNRPSSREAKRPKLGVLSHW